MEESIPTAEISQPLLEQRAVAPDRKRQFPWIAIGIIAAAVMFIGIWIAIPPKHLPQGHIPVLTADVPVAVPPTEAKILVVGDMMFDRYIRTVAETKGPDFLFSCVDPLLQEADFVIGNLEGPITANASVSQGSEIGSPDNFRFTFPTSTAELLFQHNIKAVSIGNNHIGNFGSEGISATRRFLTEAGVGYFGGLVDNTSVYRTSVGGADLSLVSFNQFGGETVAQVARQIADEHASGRVVIVYAHWGEEYIEVMESIRSIATLFAQSGADIVIGSHPHVVQSNERIGTTPVYYSLGNFIFDQYWKPSVREGLALMLHVRDGQIELEERPVTLGRDGTTCPAPGQ